MTKRINWKWIYKNLEHFFDRCGNAFEKMVQGCMGITILMGIVALLTSSLELITTVCEFIATMGFVALLVLLGLYTIRLIATIIIKFVFAIIVGLTIICNWTCESDFVVK